MSDSSAATVTTMKRLRRTRIPFTVAEFWELMGGPLASRCMWNTAAKTACRTRGRSDLGISSVLTWHRRLRDVSVSAHEIVRCESTSYFIWCQLVRLATIWAVGQRRRAPVAPASGRRPRHPADRPRLHRRVTRLRRSIPPRATAWIELYNVPGSRRVRPAGLFFDTPHDFVAVKIVISQRHQDLERRRGERIESGLRHNDDQCIDNRLCTQEGPPSPWRST
jgi:hypothetical protein